MEIQISIKSLNPNQKKHIGLAGLREQSMVDAHAFGQYADYLSTSITAPPPSDNEYFSTEELKEIKTRIDVVLEDISQMKFELQSGQQVLFDEIDELKSLPTLKKKTWVEVIRGKLFGLVVSKVISIELFHKIYKELTGSDIKLLGE
jgi:hypothetical protein